MTSNTTAYYRTDDVLENFKIKINVRELSRLQNTPSNENRKNNKHYDKDLIISWQEKLYSPSDIANYIKKKDDKKEQLPNDQRSLLSDSENGIINIENLLDDVMIYTYVDREHYVPDATPILYDSKGVESYVSKAVSRVGIIKNARDLKVSQRVIRENPFKIMHICFATDVDVETLRTKKPWDPEYYYTEHVLCTIKVYKDGLVEVSPPFSPILEEIGDSVAHDGSTVPSVFSNEITIKNSVNKGFRIKTDRLRSKTGSEYEYCIQNLNQLKSPQDIEDFINHSKDVDKEAAIASRGLDDQGLATWKQDPPGKLFDKTITIYAEIVSGSGFYGRNLFVSYQTEVPQGWEIREGNTSDGVAESDIGKDPNLSERANLIKSNSIKQLDGYRDGLEAKGALQGTTQTAYVAESTRGLINLPNRPRWKGHTAAFEFGSATRLFLGLFFFILSVLAIVVGSEYPFWLLPSLVIVFTVGTGIPGGVTQVILKNKSKIKSGNPIKKLSGPLISQPSANFNHLINLSFDVKDRTLESIEGSNQGASESPTIFFQVHSIGWFGRYSLEGYGYFRIPERSGSYDDEIKTWRPAGNIDSKMKDQFLGNSLRLRDESFIEIQDKSVNALNKFGVLSESSGTLRFRMNIIMSDPRKVHSKKQTIIDNTKNSNYVRRTVDDILQSFRSSSGMKSVQASAVKSSSDGSVRSSNPDRVNEILSRYRARNSPNPSPTEASAANTPFMPNRFVSDNASRRYQSSDDENENSSIDSSSLLKK